MSQALQALFESLPDGVHEHRLQGFGLLAVKAPWGELAVAGQGAQVLHYRPAGEAPLLWLSDSLKPSPAAIRGGVPLCWPWFGNHPSDPAQPAHGVARTASWRWWLDERHADGVVLRAVPAAPLWPGLDPGLYVAVRNRALTIAFETLNSGDTGVELSQALHSYLAVDDVGQVTVQGLDGCEYLDKLRDGARARQGGDLRIAGALDRVYRHEGVTEVLDPVVQRCLRVTKSGSGSTVVWNPGEAAATMADVGVRQQSEFICIEAANTALDPVRLAPGERCRLETTIALAGSA